MISEAKNDRGIHLINVRLRDEAGKGSRLCPLQVRQGRRGHEPRDERGAEAGGGGGAEPDAPAEGAEGLAAEELADAGGLDDRGEGGGGNEAGGDDERAAPADDEGLAELGADEADEGDGSGPARGDAGEPSAEPAAHASAGGECCADDDVAGERDAKRRVGPFVQQGVGGGAGGWADG